jgi:hypothetical protein
MGEICPLSLKVSMDLNEKITWVGAQVRSLINIKKQLLK